MNSPGHRTHLAASFAHVLSTCKPSRHVTAHTELAVLPGLGESLVWISIQPLLFVPARVSDPHLIFVDFY